MERDRGLRSSGGSAGVWRVRFDVAGSDSDAVIGMTFVCAGGLSWVMVVVVVDVDGVGTGWGWVSAA